MKASCGEGQPPQPLVCGQTVHCLRVVLSQRPSAASVPQGICRLSVWHPGGRPHALTLSLALSSW